MIELLDRIRRMGHSLLPEFGVPETRDAILRDQFDHHRIATLLPWESWDEDTGFYFNTDSFGFVLECAPASGLGEEDAKSIASIFTQNLPPHTGLQFCLSASPAVMPQLTEWARGRIRSGDRPSDRVDEGPRINARTEGAFSHIARARIDHLKPLAWRSLLRGEALLIRDFRLFVSVCFPLPGNASRAGDLRNAENVRASAIGTLATAGIHARDAHPDQLIDFVDDLVNPRAGREPKRAPRSWDPLSPIRDQVPMPDTGLVVFPDHLRINDTEVRTLTAANYPRQWWLGSMDELIGDFFEGIKRYPCPFVLTASVYIPDQINAKQMAKMKSARATQATQSPIARFVPSWFEKKAEWDYVNEKVDEGHTLCKVSHQLLLYSPLGEGEIHAQQVRSLLGAKGWEFVPDRYLQLPAWMSALPLTLSRPLASDLSQFNRMRTMLTWTAANLLPLIAEWKGIRRKPEGDEPQYPLIQLIGRRGQIMDWDPFGNEGDGNFNIAIAASSGSGKSFFTQEMIMNLLSDGGRCWVIDAGESYRWLCRLLEGEYIEFTPTSRICLNPFTQIEDWEDGIAMLKPLVAQMAFPNDAPSDFQMSAIERALNAVWRDKGQEAEITDVRDWLAAQDDQRVRDIAEHLYPYAREGMYGRWFAGPATVSLSEQLTVLELSGLNNKPDLQTVVLMLLMMRISQAMYLGDRMVRKACIIDEAWRLLGSGRSGQFIEEGYRVVRKFGGLFCTITQSIEDYYKSPVAQAAFENSDWTLLLRQKEDAIDQLDKASKLAMTAYKKRAIKSLKMVKGAYSEVMIIGRHGWAIGRLAVDPFSGRLYSTTARDFEQIRRMTESGLTVHEAVMKLMEGGR